MEHDFNPGNGMAPSDKDAVERLAMDLESRLHLIGVYGVGVTVVESSSGGWVINLAGAAEKVAIANRLLRKLSAGRVASREPVSPRVFLHLEDDPMDAELMGIGFETLFTACKVIAVSNRAQFLSALSRGGFDGIISDSGVSDLPGTEAVAFARELAPAIPFVFLCGAMSEERRNALLATRPDALLSKDDPSGNRDALQRIFGRRSPN